MVRQMAAGLVIHGYLVALLAGCIMETGSNPITNPSMGTRHSESQVDSVPLALHIEIQNPLPSVHHLSDIHFSTSKTGYIVGQHGLILKTVDAGTTFTDTVLGGENLNAVAFFDSDRGIAVGNHGILLTTSDGGSTWKHRFIGGGDLFGLCSHFSGKALAVGETGTLLVSTDLGMSWTLVDGGTGVSVTNCAFQNADTAYAIGGEFLLMTVNGGKTWTKSLLLDASNATAYLRLEKLRPTGARVGYGITDEAPVRTIGSLLSWRSWQGGDPFTKPQGILDLVVTPNGKAHLVGRGGRIYTGEVEDGSPWIRRATLTDNDLVAVDFPSEDTGYAAGEYGEILRTLDGGATWNSMSRAVTRKDLAAVHFVDAGVGYAVGAAGTLLKTVDGGAAWIRLDGAASRNLADVHFLDAETGCVVGESGTALWTRDGGKTWTLGGTGTSNPLASVRLISASLAYAIGDWRTLIKTVDGGLTWTPVPIPYEPYGWDIGDGLFYDGTRLTEATNNIEIYQDCLCYRYRSQVGGNDWRHHHFRGKEDAWLDYAHAGGSRFYGVSGSAIYSLDTQAPNLRFLHSPVPQPLSDIHCPEASICFAVGSNGVILRLDIP